MFKKLVSQKNPVVPTEEIRRAVNSILGEGAKYWNYAANLIGVYMGDDAQEAKKGYDEAIEKYHLIQKTVAQIVDIWPQGLELVKEFQEMAGLGIKMAENDYSCGKYIHTANSENPEYISRSREFVARRHQYADMIDNKQLHIQKMLLSSKINQQ